MLLHSEVFSVLLYKMVAQALFIILTLYAYQGYGLTEVRLEDRNVHMIRHELIGSSITIPKPIFDTLRSCHVTYPNGERFEAYPKNNLPHENIFFNSAVQPFTTCSIGFRNVAPEFSGTYELVSSIVSSVNNGVTLTRQKFNIRITEMS